MCQPSFSTSVPRANSRAGPSLYPRFSSRPIAAPIGRPARYFERKKKKKRKKTKRKETKREKKKGLKRRREKIGRERKRENEKGKKKVAATRFAKP